ncbi:MAG: CARDB domain-containing protein [Candidatus Methylacidiphilales bacterium]|nr:CARDB domain-containing protein [Candidatus Methylacidiphilales bacterium]
MKTLFACLLFLTQTFLLPTIIFSAPYPQPAYPSDQFIDSIGLNASPFERYLDSGPFKGAGTHYPPELFFDLGVRYYRTGLKHDLVRPESPDLIAAACRKYGARPLMLIDPHKTGSPDDLVKEIKRYPAGVIWGVEGPNELNNKFPPQELNLKYQGKTDEAAGAAYMKDAIAALRADPATKNLPVVAFTAIFSDYRLARPHTGFDFANMHSYQGYDVPSSSLMTNVTRFNNIFPVGHEIQPFMPTECGYNVESDVSNGTHKTGSLRAQALNIPMLLAEYFRHGIPRTYLFALHNADGYGLLENDQATRRPSWFALKNFIAELSDARWNAQTMKWEGGSLSPRALLFVPQGAPDTLHSLTLQKTDGSYRLLLWNEVPNFDSRIKQDLTPPPLPVVLRFLRPIEEEVEVLTQNDQGTYDLYRVKPESEGKVLRLKIPSSVTLLRLRQPDGKQSLPASVTDLVSETTENEVLLRWKAPPKKDSTAGFFVFRAGHHVATLPPDTTEWRDRSDWIRPGLGYPYEIQSYNAEGGLSARSRHIAQTPDKRPDLIVTATGTVQQQINPGDPVQFWATVKNIGTGATPYETPLSATFSVDGHIISWGGIHRPLAPGEEVRVEGGGGPHQPPVWNATEGAHLLLARADDINRISGETSKTNNWIDQTLQIGEAGKGKLSGSSQPAPGSLDLEQGFLEDWVVWGGGNKDGRVQKAKSPCLIGPLKYSGEGHVAHTVGGPVRLSWNNGDPVAQNEGTNEALWMNHLGHAFQFEVMADETERELKVYAAGLEGATGRFRADLSDGSAPAYESCSWNGNMGNGNWSAVPDGFSVVFTVRYHASKSGEKLRITWELVDEPNRFLGQIRLQSATLKRAISP